MEPIYKPEETAQIRNCIGNHLLIVEFNPISLKWEISEPAHGCAEYAVPEIWVSDWVKNPSSTGFISLSIPFEYYSVCGTYSYWGQHVFDDMLSRRPECKEAKEIINEIDEFNDKAEKKRESNMEEVREQTKKEIMRHAFSPTIYSYSKVS